MGAVRCAGGLQVGVPHRVGLGLVGSRGVRARAGGITQCAAEPQGKRGGLGVGCPSGGRGWLSLGAASRGAPRGALQQ